jgi:hypothetical protein
LNYVPAKFKLNIVFLYLVSWDLTIREEDTFENKELRKILGCETDDRSEEGIKVHNYNILFP